MDFDTIKNIVVFVIENKFAALALSLVLNCIFFMLIVYLIRLLRTTYNERIAEIKVFDETNIPARERQLEALKDLEKIIMRHNYLIEWCRENARRDYENGSAIPKTEKVP